MRSFAIALVVVSAIFAPVFYFTFAFMPASLAWLREPLSAILVSVAGYSILNTQRQLQKKFSEGAVGPAIGGEFAGSVAATQMIGFVGLLFVAELYFRIFAVAFLMLVNSTGADNHALEREMSSKELASYVLKLDVGLISTESMRRTPLIELPTGKLTHADAEPANQLAESVALVAERDTEKDDMTITIAKQKYEKSLFDAYASGASIAVKSALILFAGLLGYRAARLVSVRAFLAPIAFFVIISFGMAAVEWLLSTVFPVVKDVQQMGDDVARSFGVSPLVDRLLLYICYTSSFAVAFVLSFALSDGTTRKLGHIIERMDKGSRAILLSELSARR